MKSRYTREQVQLLKKNSSVAGVYKRTFVLKPSAYRLLYEAWKSKRDVSAIRNELLRMGLNSEVADDEYVSTIIWDFGRMRGYAPSVGRMESHASEVALVASGIFHGKGSTVCWDVDIKKSLMEAYPEQSIEDGIIKLGISPELVGFQRISALKQAIKKNAERIARAETSSFNSDVMTEEAPDEINDGAYIYMRHPYVKEVTGRKTILMSEAFFNETIAIHELPMQTILKIYEIDPEILSNASVSQISHEMMTWNKTDAVQYLKDSRYVRIQVNRVNALYQYTERMFTEIRIKTSKLSPLQKKVLCRQIAEYPTSLKYPCGYSIREILAKIGISKSTYYKALNCKGYGMADELRREQDTRDLALLMEVVDYKGFEKGLRQIYMMMPDITGEQFAISKIRRLLRRAGIKTKVRGENPARQRAREFHERNTKPNLLKREFRLHRPNEVRLTDVTYLDYGCAEDGAKLRAYGSSCIDPVTGKLLAFNVSGNNDVELALGTLERLSDHPTMIGALFHSDQGILYLTDEFQAKVAEMGMVQSMSKRGNCWDNAPQESFFGHFKDECHYEECETFEQLQTMIDEYAYYYNHERHQWSRNRMTPIEYEAYMEAMTDEEFAAYMEAEQDKYANMKKNAEQKARERAKTLGV